jgi:hypothetical protein
VRVDDAIGFWGAAGLIILSLGLIHDWVMNPLYTMVARFCDTWERIERTKCSKKIDREKGEGV